MPWFGMMDAGRLRARWLRSCRCWGLLFLPLGACRAAADAVPSDSAGSASGAGGGPRDAGSADASSAARVAPVLAGPGWNGDWAWAKAAYGFTDDVKLAPLADGSAYVAYTFYVGTPLLLEGQSYVPVA